MSDLPARDGWRVGQGSLGGSAMSLQEREAVRPPEKEQKKGVSVRRDRIGRGIARGLGVAAIVFSIPAAFTGDTLRDRLIPLVTGISFAAWIFHKARTAPGPAVDDPGDSGDPP